MSSLFNKIQRLKRQPGWSWEHFIAEIDSLDPNGIKLKLLQRYHRSPNKKPVPRLIRIIDQLHNECFPSPFPESLERLMRVYRELKMSSRYITKNRDIRDLEAHAKRLLTEVADGDDLSEASLQWLLANIEFDRIADYVSSGEGDQMVVAKQHALEHNQAVLVAIEQHNSHYPAEPISAHLIYQVHSNMLACYLNAVPEEQRSQNTTILQYVRESGYLEQCKQAVAAEPFQWAIARNGLRFSSLLKDAAEVKHFFSLLLTVHPRFVDLSYDPFNRLPITQMPDCQWAKENVLTPQYIAEKTRELNEPAGKKRP